MKSIKKYVPISCFLVFLVWFSIYLSHHTLGTDFPVYYSSAKAILDGQSVYDIEVLNNYALPESMGNNTYIYSLPVAYFMAPLALLPYHLAKAAMIFFIVISYLFSVGVVLKFKQENKIDNGSVILSMPTAYFIAPLAIMSFLTGKISIFFFYTVFYIFLFAIMITIEKEKGKRFMYPLLLSLLFQPFIENLRYVQVNCLILVLIVLSIFFAIKKVPYLCGLFLAFATLFKIFPIAVAMILGIKDWKIIATCIFVIAVSFFIPGSHEWWKTARTNGVSYIPLFNYLGTFWFLIYGIVIAGLSALFVWRSKKEDYLLFTSLAVSAVLIIHPLITYHHLVLLIIPYAYLFSYHKKNVFNNLILLISFILVCIPTLNSIINLNVGTKSLVTYGLVPIWGVLAWETIRS